MFKDNIIFRLVYKAINEKYLPNYKPYIKTYNLIQNTQYLSPEEIKRFQFNKLKKIVNYTWENIHGYREYWRNNGFKPSYLRSLEDIKLIPCITKEMLRDNLDSFSNKKIKNVHYSTTGGTTGLPLGFYSLKQLSGIEQAFTMDIWRQQYPNLKYKDTSTILRATEMAGIYRRRYNGELYLSTFKLTKDNFKQYADLIDKYQTVFLQAFPSTLYIFTKTMIDEGLKLKHKFKFISLASEAILSFQEELISDYYKTMICRHFGSTERVVVGSNCRNNKQYHIYPQYGITELINPQGKEVQEGEVGEIVGTSFWRLATPFIRYKTMDYAEKGNNYCKYCKRHYQLYNRILGREQGFLVGKDKSLLAALSLNMHSDVFDDLLYFKFFQDKIGDVIFQFVKKKSDQVLDDNRILQAIKSKLGNNFTLNIEEVKDIPFTIRGKRNFVDQRLKISDFI